MSAAAHETGDRAEPVESIQFRPLTRADFPALHGWLNAPHVRGWWPREPPTPDGLEDKYGPRIDGIVPVRVFVFGFRGEPAGMAQCFRWADRPQRRFPVAIPAAGSIDFLLGEARHRGKGVAFAAFAAFVRLVLGLYPDINFLVGYPHKDNNAFRRILEKTGYQRLDEVGSRLGLPGPSAGDSNIVYVLPRDVVVARCRNPEQSS